MSDVYFLSNNKGKALPMITDKTVMTYKAKSAPVSTSPRECFMAIMAAMKNVLSPSSVTRIMRNDWMDAVGNPVPCNLACTESGKYAMISDAISFAETTSTGAALINPTVTPHHSTNIRASVIHPRCCVYDMDVLVFDISVSSTDRLLFLIPTLFDCRNTIKNCDVSLLSPFPPWCHPIQFTVLTWLLVHGLMVAIVPNLSQVYMYF
mmetsp:Transcript_12070/g.20626  ORF Transcript_12070/g.20626 Transcript_12070/m.20626 type:complete len:207 (-) Transcript_12070:1208-1828(-)